MVLYSLVLEKSVLTNVSEWSVEMTLCALSSGFYLLSVLVLDCEVSRSAESHTRRNTAFLVALLVTSCIAHQVLSPFAGFQKGFLFAVLNLNICGAMINLLLALIACCAQRLDETRQSLRTATEIYVTLALKLAVIYRDCYKVVLFNATTLEPSVRIHLFKAVMDVMQLFGYLLVLADLTRIRRLRVADSALSSDCECSICLENIAEGVLTKCGHIFHYVCLDLLLKNNSNRKCPYCGQPLEFLDPRRPAESRLRAWLSRFRVASLPATLCFFQEKSRFFVVPPPPRRAFLH